MFKSLLVKNSHDIFFAIQDLSVVSEKSLSLIAPSPRKADLLRGYLNKFDIHVDVLTYAKFVKNELQRVGKEQFLPRRKSELLRSFWSYTQHHPELCKLSYPQFQSAYKAYTDYRSMGLEVFLDDYLQLLDRNLAEACQFFQIIQKKFELADEHTSLHELIASEQQSVQAGEDGNQIYIFWGFRSLSALQIQWLKRLGKLKDVIVIIPDFVYERSKPWDWPKECDPATKLQSLARTSLDENANQSPQEKITKAYTVPSQVLPLFLSQYAQQKNSLLQVVFPQYSQDEKLMHKQPDGLSEMQYVFNPFEVSSTQVLENCKMAFWGKTVTIENVIEHFYLNYQSQIKKIKQDFSQQAGAIELKIYQLVGEICRKVKADIPPGHLLNLDDFLEFLKDQLQLDSPRLYLQSENSQPLLKIFHLDEVLLLDSQGPIILSILDDYSSAQKAEALSDPEKILARLGPIKTSRLEALFLESECRSLLERDDLEVVFNPELFEENIFWKNLLSKFTKMQICERVLTQSERLLENSLFKTINSPSSQKDYASASILQSYLDCPQRYRWEKELAVVPQFDSSEELSAKESGILQHKLLEKLWMKYQGKTPEDDFVQSAVLELYHIQTLNKNIDHSSQAFNLLILKKMIMTGYSQLSLIVSELKDPHVSFEISFRNQRYKGIVDCLIQHQAGFIILDFKKSANDYPSYLQFQRQVDKIQLWLYLEMFLEKNSWLNDCPVDIGIGYLFLADPKKSWLLYHSKNQAFSFKSEVYKNWSQFTEQFTDWRQFALQLFDKWRQDTAFLPHPRKRQVCDRCRLSFHCAKAFFKNKESLRLGDYENAE
jgi:hypothetical protein